MRKYRIDAKCELRTGREWRCVERAVDLAKVKEYISRSEFIRFTQGIDHTIFEYEVKDISDGEEFLSRSALWYKVSPRVKNRDITKILNK